MDWWIWALEYGPWRAELDLKRDVGGFQYLDSLSTRLIDGKVINAMGWEWEAKTPKPIMPNVARSMQLTAKSSLGKGISAKNRIWQGASLDLTTHYNPLLCLTSQRPERFSKLNWVTKWSEEKISSDRHSTGWPWWSRRRGLGWVDYDIGHFSVCPFLLGQLKIWQNRLDNWARCWNIQIKVNPTKVRDLQSQPVDLS